MADRRSFRCMILPGLLLLAAAAAGCETREQQPTPDQEGQVRSQVATALQRYQAAARTVDPESIAAFYTTTGTLFEPGINPVQGRNAIRAFVASFPGARVDSAEVTADTIEVFGRTAYVWGSYFERLSFPGQPTSEQHGKFVAEWVRDGAGNWLIERLFRVPVPTPGSPATPPAPPPSPR